jgi:hypothetical protein
MTNCCAMRNVLHLKKKMVLIILFLFVCSANTAVFVSAFICSNFWLYRKLLLAYNFLSHMQSYKININKKVYDKKHSIMMGWSYFFG